MKRFLWPAQLAGALFVWCSFLAVVGVSYVLVAVHTVLTEAQEPTTVYIVMTTHQRWTIDKEPYEIHILQRAYRTTVACQRELAAIEAKMPTWQDDPPLKVDCLEVLFHDE